MIQRQKLHDARAKANIAVTMGDASRSHSYEVWLDAFAEAAGIEVEPYHPSPPQDVGSVIYDVEIEDIIDGVPYLWTVPVMALSSRNGWVGVSNTGKMLSSITNHQIQSFSDNPEETLVYAQTIDDFLEFPRNTAFRTANGHVGRKSFGERAYVFLDSAASQDAIFIPNLDSKVYPIQILQIPDEKDN